MASDASAFKLPQEYTDSIQTFIDEMDDTTIGSCQLGEWFREDLPLEEKNGGTIMRESQVLLSKMTPPQAPTQDHLQKPSKGGATQLPMPVAPPPKENIIVFEDSYGYTDTVLKNAPEGRIGTKKVVKGQWGQFTMSDIKDMLCDKPLSMIIFGATCDIPTSNEVSDILDFQTDVMRLAFYVVKVIVDNELEIEKICFLTRGTFEEGRELHEQVGLSLITFAPLYGFCNTARAELEVTKVHLIDTEYFLKPPFWDTTDYQLGERLASEVWRNETFGKNTVRVLNKGRYVTRHMIALPYAEKAERPFKLPEPGQIVAISGGNGGLGQVMAGWLCDRAEAAGVGGFEIQMLSRSCSISQDNQAIYEIVCEKAKRNNISYVHKKCNLTSQEVADDFLKSTDGKLCGFIHSAGVLQDSLISSQSWDKFEAVWNPKHRAAMYLHQAFETMPHQLEFFWMFSSVAVLGSPGQLNYSASNAGQDGIARHRSALGKPGFTVQWGGWGEIGMAANMDEGNRRRMAMSPMPSFPNVFGLTGLDIGLRTNVPTVTVCKINPYSMCSANSKDDAHGVSYSRNFFGECLPPVASAADKWGDYTLYRHLCWQLRNTFNRRKLTWDAYMPAIAESEEQKEEGGYCPDHSPIFEAERHALRA